MRFICGEFPDVRVGRIPSRRVNTLRELKYFISSQTTVSLLTFDACAVQGAGNLRGM